MKGLHFNKDYYAKNYYRIIAAAAVLLTAAALILNIHITNSQTNIQSNIPHGDGEENNITQQASVPAEYAQDFSDTAFIGDSRTQGLMLYSGLPDATFYTATGLTVKDVTEKPEIETDSGKITIIEAMKQKKFARIYIMLGINELGWAYSDLFRDAYSSMLDQIISVQPDAKIYVESILPVNREMIKKPKEHMTNEKISEYNDIIKEICSEKNIEYVDVAAIMTDDSGNLYEQATTDGIHLNKAFCDRWIAFLKGEKLDEISEN